MKSYSERLQSLIEIIRERDEWAPNHRGMEFGGVSVGYYDTTDKSDYFIIKFEGVEVNHRNIDGIEITWESWEKYNTFNLNEWLTKLEVIMKRKTLTLDGKEYLLTEVEGK